MPKSIVVVDSRVTYYQALIDGLPQSAEVFILDGELDRFSHAAAVIMYPAHCSWRSACDTAGVTHVL